MYFIISLHPAVYLGLIMGYLKGWKKMSEQHTNYARLPTEKATILLPIRNEEKGIANQLLKNCDSLAKIPMAGEIASLNVSVAAAIILFEAVKQRLN